MSDVRILRNEKKSTLAEKAYQLAHDYDLQYGCSPQCVLAAIRDTVGVITDDVIKAAHILSQGGGLLGIGTCGALAGGLMALSCKYGNAFQEKGKGQYTKGMLKGRLLIKRFETEYEGISCNHIQKKFTGRTYDMWSNDDEAKEFKEKYCKEICPKVSGNVAKWVLALI